MDKYIEIDMSDTVMKKASAVRSKKNLFEKHLPNLTFKRMQFPYSQKKSTGK